MDYTPFDNTYRFDPDIFIEDFPDYLMERVKRWILSTMRSSDITNGNALSRPFKDELELRLRVVLPVQVPSFVNFMTVDTAATCNMLTLLLQNYAQGEEAENLKTLLREASSAYTVEPMSDIDPEDIRGGHILVNRIPAAVREQAGLVLSSSDVMLRAWNACYKVEPDYVEAVSVANDFIEGLLRDKFWSGRSTTYSIAQAISQFERDETILHFKGDSFVTDKTKVIGLLEGIARIRGEHTTGAGRSPTPDEADYVVQTCIYLYSLFEPVIPTSNN